MPESPDSFKTRSIFPAAGGSAFFYRLADLERRGPLKLARMPFCIRILLENVLRNEDGKLVDRSHIEALAEWRPGKESGPDIPFYPARVLLQDLTGIPVLVDLASMRDAAAQTGVSPERVNPVIPADMIIDHSVAADHSGRPDALAANMRLEHERNRERYACMRWGQRAFANFRVVPPGRGIIHQVNLEHLAGLIRRRTTDGGDALFPDTVLGADSHTTMVNALGILGWGVGGIEAIAAMLGFPVILPMPEVVGCLLSGRLGEGITASDLALTITQKLRAKGVVGKFVEFICLDPIALSLPDRACVANMAPEYGATAGFFPADSETLSYMAQTGRDPEAIALARAYLKEQGLCREENGELPRYSEILELDLATVEPSAAGPKRPHDRAALSEIKSGFEKAFPKREAATVNLAGKQVELRDGSVVIAAITSCTTTSNPRMLMAAGLLAKKAVEAGLAAGPAVKTSLAPGSRAVKDYLDEAGLTPYLERLGFHVVGYGCMTCIGNSGPLPEPVVKAAKSGMALTAVLSGNRNFEGRIHPAVKANYLVSPPLVVAYALAGRVDIDLTQEPLGRGKDGKPVFLKEIWPDRKEVDRLATSALRPGLFANQRSELFEGDETWKTLPVSKSAQYAWDPESTYIRSAPWFEGFSPKPEPVSDIKGARVLALLGDSISTDHISPAGTIPEDSPAGKYLSGRGVPNADFNSYGSRRGNHEVMVRGTFASIRLRNLLVPEREGGYTLDFLSGREATIFEAAESYRAARTPLIVIAGREYGCGSSRDWAAKGTALLGVRAVIAAGFERLHRGNLAGMGVLALEFLPGQDARSLGLTGHETFDIAGIGKDLSPGARIDVSFRRPDGSQGGFPVKVRLDTKADLECYSHGGLLPLLLRRFLEEIPA